VKNEKKGQRKGETASPFAAEAAACEYIECDLWRWALSVQPLRQLRGSVLFRAQSE